MSAAEAPHAARRQAQASCWEEQSRTAREWSSHRFRRIRSSLQRSLSERTAPSGRLVRPNGRHRSIALAQHAAAGLRPRGERRAVCGEAANGPVSSACRPLDCPLLRHDSCVTSSDSFLAWGRSVVNSVADRLEESIPAAKRGNESHLPGYEAIYVHLVDAKITGRIAVWAFAAREGSANNVRGYRDAIGIGLKRDADVELVPGEFRFRRLTPWRWQRQVDERYEGFRWLRNADELPSDPDHAAQELADQVIRTMQAAEILK